MDSLKNGGIIGLKIGYAILVGQEDCDSVFRFLKNKAERRGRRVDLAANIHFNPKGSRSPQRRKERKG
jgi:hypothetical protein